MTGLRGLVLMSITGAKLRFMPTAANSSAVISPAFSARDSERVAPNARLPGKTVAPFFNRVTIPPSWSIAMNSGIALGVCTATCWSSVVKFATCCGDWMFRRKRMIPPAKRLVICALATWLTCLPPIPTMRSCPIFSSMDIRFSVASISASVSARAGTQVRQKMRIALMDSA